MRRAGFALDDGAGEVALLLVASDLALRELNGGNAAQAVLTMAQRLADPLPRARKVLLGHVAEFIATAGEARRRRG